MGTTISLRVAEADIAWAKNGPGEDHGPLFQDNDRTRFRSEQLSYSEVDPNDPELELEESGFARNLAELVPRLELLGFTLARVEAEYSEAARQSAEDTSPLACENAGVSERLMTFPEFRAFVSRRPIGELDNTFLADTHGDAKRRWEDRFFEEASRRRIPRSWSYELGSSERTHFLSLMMFLHPYSILRVLAECPMNADARVDWQFGPVVSSGWAEEHEFLAGARRSQTFLIATEGSSDTHILKHAFSLLRPGIRDFFRFIDMGDGHPFPGAGNLVKFARGLAKIDVHNQVLLLLDNDAEGTLACREIQRSFVSSNMLATTLPPLDELRAIPARGPEGVSPADINGRAAAIECYLDLAVPADRPTEVRWTSYKEKLNAYQGKLCDKESYRRAFLEQRTASVTSYDFSKIAKVLDHIVAVCTDVVSCSSRVTDERSR